MSKPEDIAPLAARIYATMLGSMLAKYPLINSEDGKFRNVQDAWRDLAMQEAVQDAALLWAYVLQYQEGDDEDEDGA